MQPITATVRVGARDVTVHELSMQQIRHLIASAEQSEKSEQSEQAQPAEAQPSTPPTPERWLAIFVGHRLLIDGVHMDYIKAMSDLADEDYAAALPSQLGQLAERVKALNPFFFEHLLQLRSSRGSYASAPAPSSNEPA